MTDEPFREMATEWYQGMRLVDMQTGSNDARSSAWWNNLINYGAWRGPGKVRVSPPPPEAIPGIASLFGISEEEVQRLIAADWYGVQPPPNYSDRVRRWVPLIDRLKAEDANEVRRMMRRLVTGSYDLSSQGATKKTA